MYQKDFNFMNHLLHCLIYIYIYSIAWIINHVSFKIYHVYVKIHLFNYTCEHDVGKINKCICIFCFPANNLNHTTEDYTQLRTSHLYLPTSSAYSGSWVYVFYKSFKKKKIIKNTMRSMGINVNNHKRKQVYIFKTLCIKYLFV